MRRGLIGVLLLSVASCEPAYAGETRDNAPTWSHNDCPVACVVVYNPGGLINDFRRAALQLRAEGRLLIIDGECDSACSMAADAARPRVCITPRAKFGFHKTFEFDAKGAFVRRDDPKEYYSADINAWVQRHGGYPGKSADDRTLLMMDYGQAKALFKTCEGSV